MRKVRKRCGLSQKKMAAMLGIATSTYQYYERGERDTPAHIFCKLVTMFKVSPRWLLTGEGEMFMDLESAPSEDETLRAIISFIRAIWDKGNEKEKNWFEIQFQKCFPEFAERRNTRT